MKAQKDRGDGLIAVLGGSSSGMLIFLALVVDNPIMAFLLPQKIAFSCDIGIATSGTMLNVMIEYGLSAP